MKKKIYQEFNRRTTGRLHLKKIAIAKKMRSEGKSYFIIGLLLGRKTRGAAWAWVRLADDLLEIKDKEFIKIYEETY